MGDRPTEQRQPRESREPRERGGRDRDDGSGMDDNVVKVYRCAKVVKGGRRFSFAALVVVGDRNGSVGMGYAKANEVPNAVDKGRKHASRAINKIRLSGSTIPHTVLGTFGASRVKLIPASQGTGVIAGASVRAVLELAGVKDCLTKAYGSTSPKNLVKATMNALTELRDRDMVERLRGVKLSAG